MQITEITSMPLKRIPLKKFNGKVKAFERQLKLNILKSDEKEKSEWRLLQKEIRSLITRDGEIYVTVTPNGLPLFGELLMELSSHELNFTVICDKIRKWASVKYIPSMDIGTLLWQGRFCLIYRYFNEKIKNSELMEGLGCLSDIDENAISTALDPLERIYSEDLIYNSMTAETQNLYRRMTSEIANATGRDEQRIAKEYMIRREYKSHNAMKSKFSHLFFTNDGTAAAVPAEKLSPFHVGKIIFNEYRQVFPFKKPTPYGLTLLLISAVLSIITGFFFGISEGIISLLPLMAAIKPIVDLSVIKTARITCPPPAMELSGSIPLEAKTLCVISTLLSSPKDAKLAWEKLESVREKNSSDNLVYCLLCDLPPAKTKEKESDLEIIKGAEEVFKEKKNSVIFIRERSYSKTQKTWQGKERKRGAILSLAEFLRKNQNNGDFAGIFGDKYSLKNIRYILALDYDTIPLMGSISELAAIALHPLSAGAGIIAPRMTTTLTSYLKTGFSRAMGDNGGTAGASTYDSFAGEMYQDAFGEGTFTGKGLINVDMLLKHCRNKQSFPPERVLSHDILEGGHLGVIYAGNVEFSDNFPETSAAYFKRQHRWLRGDLQNFPRIFDKNINSLTKLKLIDNVRRALTPVFSLVLFVFGIFALNNWLMWIGILSVVAPYLMGFIPSLFRGWRFSNYRKFYAPVVSQTIQLIRQCLLELMLLPKNALVSLDAFLRVLWRMIISKRRLLDWTTSHSFGSGKKGHTHMAGAAIVSYIILFLSALNFNIWGCVISALFVSALPVLIFIDKAKGDTPKILTSDMKEEILGQVGQMWKFYKDYVTVEHSFLPPDNVQYSPVYRVSPRTSPTNIGMYLLSVLSVYYLKIIDKDELYQRVSETINSVIKLKKWRGNLMNWYDTNNLNVISSFVSSVDSGNFLASLVALKEGLINEGINNELISQIEKIIKEADLGGFFNQSKQLFSIGFDLEKCELSRHHYDLIMSESRMMSYYAVSMGIAGKRHWRNLGRTMGKEGRYAAPIAWTGTMFEYFMPELLLKSKVGSMEYESLRFALHCQKKIAAKLSIPFGMSESGYYAFDNELNYQYKAHGVGAIGLKEGLDRECVVSPYSSYLAMELDPISAYNNLVKLEKMGMRHPQYGFYEAVDFTPRRTGTGYAIVQSHMAHHVGMSIAAATNTLTDGILKEMFLRDSNMKRGEELLEEKIIAGETVIGEPERQKEEDNYMGAEEMGKFSLENLRVTAISNGSLTLICTDTGIGETIYKNISNVRRTTDLLNPRGMIFALAEHEYVIPFYYHPYYDKEISDSPQRVLFRQNTVEYYRNFRNLRQGMQVFLHPTRPIEIRRFSVENNSGLKRQITLAAYLEPTLADVRDVEAHPAFMDLFIKVEYDLENQLVLVGRKNRITGAKTFMAIGTLKEEDISYSFNREKVLERNKGIFSAFNNALLRDNEISSVPSPCVFLKIDFPIDARGKKETELFICYGESKEEVTSLALSHRLMGSEPNEEIVMPLVYDTVYGRIARRILPHILFSPKIDKEAVMKNELDINAVWQYGISGDLPIVVFFFGQRTGYIDGALRMKKALHISRIYFDLVVICNNPSEKNHAEELKREIGTEAFILAKWEIEENMLELIKAISVYQINSNDFLEPKKFSPDPKFLKINPCGKPKNQNVLNGFNQKGDTFIIANKPSVPWCNVLCNSQFGTLVSDCGLGFSWALNSRENKLTPWNNDIMNDNKGEMLLMKIGGELYDLVNGSVGEFSPNKADYWGETSNIASRVRVRVFEKGMGKEITAVIANNSKTAKKITLAFYTEPVLGVNRKNARFIKPMILGKSLVLSTVTNGVFSGAMTISADKESAFQTNRNKFFAGEWEKGEVIPSYDLCGAVIVSLELPPKYSDKVKFILSFTKNKNYPLTMELALKKQKYASQIIGGDIIGVDGDIQKLYKYWLPWQMVGCRIWARTGYYQNSGAFGFRDQLQDALAAIKVAPEIAKRQIINAAASQFSEGDVFHWWHSLMSKRKGVRTRYSDDLLWLPYVLAEYVNTTEDDSILKMQVYYLDAPPLEPTEEERYLEANSSSLKENIYDHGKRALEKGYQLGARGLILMGGGDWCDGYNNVGVKGKGESIWTSMFYIAAAEKFKELSSLVHDTTYKNKLKSRIQKLKSAIDTYGWDGDYYLRAYYDDGRVMGSNHNDLCRIDLLPQAFSVFAHLENEERKLKAVTAAVEELTDRDEGIIKLFTPPFAAEKTRQNPGYVMSYPEGVRENGGQYTHAAIWLAMACNQIGMEETARRLAQMISPLNRSSEYKTEPYYLAADIYTNPAAYGRGGWSIYTGSAGWYFNLLSELYEPTDFIN